MTIFKNEPAHCSKIEYTMDSLISDQAVGLGRSELTPLERATAARVSV